MSKSTVTLGIFGMVDARLHPHHRSAVGFAFLASVVCFASCKQNADDRASASEALSAPSASAPAVVNTPATWVEVPPGELVMGSPKDEPCRVAHEEKRDVRISGAFSMATTEVTQGQFRTTMGYNPSFWAACGDGCPVERVSWHEAAAFCNELSKQRQRTPCYRCTGARETARCTNAIEPIVQCRGYRLPTEAEWEYAARAGGQQAFSVGPIESCMTGDATADGIAWYKVNSGGMTHSAGQKKPNAWGLHDMHGNVSEWTGDWYSTDPGEVGATNPTGAPIGTEKVFRGGDWYHNPSHARSAHRECIRPDKRLTYVGFRCVVSL